MKDLTSDQTVSLVKMRDSEAWKLFEQYAKEYVDGIDRSSSKPLESVADILNREQVLGAKNYLTFLLTDFNNFITTENLKDKT